VGFCSAALAGLVSSFAHSRTPVLMISTDLRRLTSVAIFLRTLFLKEKYIEHIAALWSTVDNSYASCYDLR
jgi:hypothetical protein